METSQAISYPSILGPYSLQYRTKNQEGNGILDIPEKGTLEFYCAGYSKKDNYGINRQDYHCRLYNYTGSIGTADWLNPIPSNEYKLEIIHDPNNTYDINKAALRILFSPLGDNLKEFFSNKNSEIELGFVPARINLYLLKNIKMINDIQILKTKIGSNTKYCTTKVIIYYGHNYGNLKVKQANRFLDLLDED